uniref:Putative NADH:ubiquinone oxidoreductase intermediate-associated protein 30 n=1 Tax=Epichloe festucae TaxID=35717 RepID=R4S978_9HYPO|nr:putative NADH:ubiquinone oxidoreductase intermediate-associated protein 30 [Epichloe festucae]
MPDKILYLYGGDHAWVTTDDRVRGGASHSYLSVDSPDHARFHGHLDISTLGGAGFASQHSACELHLDLKDYDGIVVSIKGPEKADGKRYALTLKNDLASPTADGREQSSVSWEAQFVAEKPGDVKLSWDKFKATYRGREKRGAVLDLKHIKRIGLMMRSYFAIQDGDFELHLFSIAAWKHVPFEDEHDGEEEEEEDLKARQVLDPRAAVTKPWWKRLLCGLV